MRRPLVLLACLALSACAPQTRSGMQRSGRHGLINPLLDIDSSLEFKELRPFKHKVADLLRRLKADAKAEHISVYFRDLNNGPLFGFDEKEQFSPASLLKVPLLITALKQAQEDPAFLGRVVVNDVDEAAVRHLGHEGLEAGKSYTLDVLLRSMIAASDNQAAMLVARNLSAAALDEVYQDLGLIIPEVRTLEDNMTVREYATFFRILYNASYLDRRMSQKALEYLAASEFKDGLVAGVPPGTTVAHKFGERAYLDRDTKQLHDCGIIYHPAEPYVLCLMTRGKDFPALLSVLKDISALVYAEVDRQAPKP